MNIKKKRTSEFCEGSVGEKKKVERNIESKSCNDLKGL